MITSFMTEYAAPIVAAATLTNEGYKMVHAQHFSQEEFREWAEEMSPRLVTMLDVLRFRIGSPIAISASEYALGRNLGRGKTIKE